MQLDVTAPDQAADAIKRAWEAVGPIDVLVNNAGVARSSRALDTSADEWNEVLNTNLRGAFFLSQAYARRVVDEGRLGNVINVASVLGCRVAKQVIAYSVSKAALIQMTKALALEWADQGIRVNALAPGYIRTELNETFLGSSAGRALVGRIPLRRVGTAEDLAGPLLLLASDASAFMTGTIVLADGGHAINSI